MSPRAASLSPMLALAGKAKSSQLPGRSESLEGSKNDFEWKEKELGAVGIFHRTMSNALA